MDAPRTAARAVPVDWRVLAALCRRLATLAAIAALLLIAASSALDRAAADPQRLHDFGSFYESGRLARAGENPYGTGPLSNYALAGDARTYVPNLNPPVSVPLFALVARLGPAAAYRAWQVASLLAYLLALALAWRTYPERVTPLRMAWALALAPLWYTIALGQVYPFLVAAIAGAGWCFARRRPVAAGLLVGLVAAIKPNLLVWPGLLLLAGQVQAAVAAGGAFVALGALPVALYGPRIYAQWQAAQSATFVGLPAGGSSLPGVAALAGDARLGYLAAGILLVAAALWAWCRRPDAGRVAGVGMAAGLLASPIAWWTYAILIVPPALSRRWHPATWLGALLFVAPVWARLFGEGSNPPVAAVAVCAGLLIAGVALSRPDAPHTAPPYVSRP